MNRYDCIIIGAGPAGLGCALHCAQEGIRVLVLEKNLLGDTTHSWIIRNDFLKQYNLSDTIRNTIDCLTFRSFLGSEFRLKKPISSSVYEDRILKTLAERIKMQGGEIHEKETFASYRFEKNSVLIKTTENEYTGKFLIDAMGTSSRIQAGLGFYNKHAMGMGCYGYDMSDLSLTNTDETLIFDAFFPGNEYFWVIPYSPNAAFVGVFFFQPIGELSFKNPVKSLHEYIKIKKLKGTIKKVRQGIIPLTAKPFLQKNNILFIGDSASSPLPSSGFGFVRSFEEGKLCAQFTERYFKGKVKLNEYEQTINEARYPGYEMHYLISNILVNLNDQLLHKAIDNMKNIPEDYIIHFLKGDDFSLKFILQSFTHIRSTYTLQEIRDMAIKQNYKDIMLRVYSVYPRITIPILKREFQTLLREIAGKLPKDFL